ncbi:MAG: ABC transporter substrate-binding protein, partial [Acidimicrobiaceae bacterium]|nr:ABC transporter substrate-binding protein [Acidimicrobiaceae bacterium]
GTLKLLATTANYGVFPGLDPATDTSDAVDHDYMNMIYGELFSQGGKQPQPDLASSAKLSKDLKTFDIFLRHGVKFTDGTPFNAQAVIFNLKRDLNPANACICLPSFPVASMSAPNPYEVQLKLSKPFAPIENAFIASAPDWIVSPTALAKEGEKTFALNPVGAGPFEMVKMIPSTSMVLKRNPNYFEKGQPKLDGIDVTVVGSDQSAYNAIQAGQGQAYESFATYSLIPSLKGVKLTPIIPSGTGASAVQLNTTVAPFNNIKAREAMYYALDPGPINKALYLGRATATQSLRGPGELFFEPKVPGYRTYNLAKAKALVQQLGGINVTLKTETSMTPLAEAVIGEYSKAGIKVTFAPESFTDNITDYKSNNWQMKFSAGGGYDPGILLGLQFWYASNAPFTGIKDPKLDALINEGVAVASKSARAKVYGEVYKYISDQAYSPVLFFAPLFNLTAPGVTGTGLTTEGGEVLWQTVSINNKK